MQDVNAYPVNKENNDHNNQNQQDAPQVQNQQYVPQVQNQQDAPQVQNQQYAPQVQDQQYVPQNQVVLNQPADDPSKKKANIDGLSSLSRAFYERARLKLELSLVLGAAAFMLLGFSSESGGMVNRYIYLYICIYIYIYTKVYKLLVFLITDICAFIQGLSEVMKNIIGRAGLACAKNDAQIEVQDALVRDEFGSGDNLYQRGSDEFTDKYFNHQKRTAEEVAKWKIYKENLNKVGVFGVLADMLSASRIYARPIAGVISRKFHQRVKTIFAKMIFTH
jgi:hypothetical protein